MLTWPSAGPWPSRARPQFGACPDVVRRSLFRAARATSVAVAGVGFNRAVRQHATDAGELTDLQESVRPKRHVARSVHPGCRSYGPVWGRAACPVYRWVPVLVPFPDMPNLGVFAYSTKRRRSWPTRRAERASARGPMHAALDTRLASSRSPPAQGTPVQATPLFSPICPFVTPLVGPNFEPRLGQLTTAVVGPLHDICVTFVRTIRLAGGGFHHTRGLSAPTATDRHEDVADWTHAHSASSERAC